MKFPVWVLANHAQIIQSFEERLILSVAMWSQNGSCYMTGGRSVVTDISESILSGCSRGHKEIILSLAKSFHFRGSVSRM